MSNQNNFYPINGTIFDKPIKEGTSKKGKPYSIATLVLEVKRDYKGKTYTEYPEFEIGKNVHIDDFYIGDNVSISFALAGKEITWTNKEGESCKGYKTTAKALYIRHSDIDGDDTREVGGATPSDYRKKDVFVTPDIFESDNDNDPLPF